MGEGNLLDELAGRWSGDRGKWKREKQIGTHLRVCGCAVQPEFSHYLSPSTLYIPTPHLYPLLKEGLHSKHRRMPPFSFLWSQWLNCKVVRFALAPGDIPIPVKIVKLTCYAIPIIFWKTFRPIIFYFDRKFHLNTKKQTPPRKKRIPHQSTVGILFPRKQNLSLDQENASGMHKLWGRGPTRALEVGRSVVLSCAYRNGEY